MNYNNKIVQKDLENLLNEPLDFSSLKNKTLLVTGATGMLASYFIYFLMYLNDKKNMNITIYALSRSQEKLNFRFFGDKDRKDIIPVIQDVCDKIEIKENIDYIIHMASSANPTNIVENPVEIIKANLLGTFNVLELARKKDAEVIFTSTREIYGKMPEGTILIKETDMGALNCFESRSCYPESKRMAEAILVSYYLQYGVKFKNLRIAHSYGPGMNIENDGRIMSDLISDVVHKRNIILKSDGSAKRAFCYITDAVSAMLYVLINGNVAESYNIANETEEIKIRDLANLMTNIYKDFEISVEYNITENKGAYTNFKRVGLDTSKLESLGWKPKVKLAEGVKNTVESFLS